MMRFGLILAISAAVTACTETGVGPAAPALDLRAEVERVAPFLSFEPFAPDEPTPAAFDSVALWARPSATQLRTELGEPLLAVQWGMASGSKPTLRMLEGPSDCCAESILGVDRSMVVIRASLLGIADVRGEVVHVGTETTVWWNEPASSGRTFIALIGKGLDDQSMLKVAGSMRPVARRSPVDSVLLYLSTHESHNPSGHRVFLAVTTSPLPDEARIVKATGEVITRGSFDRAQPHACLPGAAGVSALAVPLDVVQQFSRGQGNGYRAEARIGSKWLQAAIVSSGCLTIE